MSSPVDPELLLPLARQDMAAGRLEAAQAKCLQVLGAYHHHPGALELLGEILHGQGRYEDAVRVFNALTLQEPSVARHWQNLGTVLRPARHYEQALAAFERALQLGGVNAWLLYNLGALQMDRLDYQAAYVALRDAAALEPRDARIRSVLAQCCYDLGRGQEAIAAVEDWEGLQGLTVDIIVQIALILVSGGAGQQARPLVEKLLQDPPRAGRAAVGYAFLLERLHRVEEARVVLDSLQRTGDAAGIDAEVLLMSAMLAQRAQQHEEACRQLDRALQNQQESRYRHNFLFPLAQSLDALGRYDEAYNAAEEAHRSQIEFMATVAGKSSADNVQPWSLTASVCDPADVASWEPVGPAMPASPIFIVGFPRSGTTLLEQVLDAHPLLQSMDEQPFLLRCVSQVTQRGVRYPTELGKLSREALDEIRAYYWERVRHRVNLGPGHRLVDKNPMNMALLPLMRRLFPEARIIMAIRHPCDAVLSCFLQHFRSDLALLCRDLPTLAGSYARAFEFWYSQRELLTPFAHELRYEQLTADFETQVRKLARFLELPWDDAMLAPGEHARAKGFISTPSYAQVLAPVNNSAVGRWQHYRQHFNNVLPLLLPWIERWGYPAP
jgi:tetratricopeptide (TPR) repeat protein